MKRNCTWAVVATLMGMLATLVLMSCSNPVGGSTTTPIDTTSYGVSYDANAPTTGIAPSDSSSYKAGASVTALGNSGVLTKTNYRFDGWNTAADGSGRSYAANATFSMPATNLKLFAKWTAATTYTLKYDSNDATSGSFPIDLNAYTAGMGATVSGVSGALKINVGGASYYANGWNTAADGSGSSYAAGSTFTISAGTNTLYVQWKAYAVYDIGPAGGRIFYVGTSYTADTAGTSYRYLECAPFDQTLSGGAFWSPSYALLTGDKTAIGTGANNTYLIVHSHGSGNYAAALCASLNIGGYDDWFLPSKDELYLIYDTLYTEALFSLTNWNAYWSSSQITAWGKEYAWSFNFAGGSWGYGLTSSCAAVRAIREF